MKILALIALIATAGTANADEANARILCALETSSATNVMMYRQNGVKHSRLLHVADELDRDTRIRWMTMVNHAFSVDVVTKDQKKSIAYEFGQIYGASCRARLGI